MANRPQVMRFVRSALGARQGVLGLTVLERSVNRRAVSIYLTLTRFNTYDLFDYVMDEGGRYVDHEYLQELDIE
jgi:hypothetical protein